jgi:hypothetical protein
LVHSSGRVVSWVDLAGYIPCVDVALTKARDIVDPMEDLVSELVPTSPLPPALDDTCVVTKDFEVFAWGAGNEEGSNEEFEPNSFCPSDVMALALPSQK